MFQVKAVAIRICYNFYSTKQFRKCYISQDILKYCSGLLPVQVFQGLFVVNKQIVSVVASVARSRAQPSGLDVPRGIQSACLRPADRCLAAQVGDGK